MSKAREHMARVGALPCAICEMIGVRQCQRTEVHHIGDTSERDDFLVIPLGEFHHRGAGGFHGLGEREFNRRYKTSEIALLAWTLRRLA